MERIFTAACLRTRLQPILVVGSRNSGKTAFVRTLVERARQHGLHVAGFCSEAEWRGSVKHRYFLQDVAAPGRRMLAASRNEEPGLDLHVGAFFLSSAAFREACRIVAESLAADLICIDECGPLEREGGGFYPAIRDLLGTYRGSLVVTVRPSVNAWLRALVGPGYVELAPGLATTSTDGRGRPYAGERR